MGAAGPQGDTAAGAPGARLTVRLAALAANYREISRRAAPAVIAPVVKADAYSLGMAEVADTLADAGADTFFVARLSEGIALRGAQPRARIFVFDGAPAGTAPALSAHHLTPVLSSLEDIVEWSAHAKTRGSMLDAGLQIDTGINRSGLSRDDVSQLAADAERRLRGIHLGLVMSHLASADTPSSKQNAEQLKRFRAALALLPPAPASFAASAGVELGRDYLFDLVRPGIALYGGNPQPGFLRANPYKTVAVLTAPVLQVRRVDKGESVGYGATFSARRPSILVTVALGYADGLMRAGGASGQAALGGVPIRFAGRISMDLVALDATEVPVESLRRGAEVEFLGDAVALDAVAKAAGTVAHEVLTSLHPRAGRHYER